MHVSIALSRCFFDAVKGAASARAFDRCKPHFSAELTFTASVAATGLKGYDFVKDARKKRV